MPVALLSSYVPREMLAHEGWYAENRKLWREGRLPIWQSRLVKTSTRATRKCTCRKLKDSECQCQASACIRKAKQRHCTRIESATRAIRLQKTYGQRPKRSLPSKKKPSTWLASVCTCGRLKDLECQCRPIPIITIPKPSEKPAAFLTQFGRRYGRTKVLYDTPLRSTAPVPFEASSHYYRPTRPKNRPSTKVQAKGNCGRTHLLSRPRHSESTEVEVDAVVEPKKDLDAVEKSLKGLALMDGCTQGTHSKEWKKGRSQFLALQNRQIDKILESLFADFESPHSSQTIKGILCSRAQSLKHDISIEINRNTKQ